MLEQHNIPRKATVHNYQIIAPTKKKKNIPDVCGEYGLCTMTIDIHLTADTSYLEILLLHVQYLNVEVRSVRLLKYLKYVNSNTFKVKGRKTYIEKKTDEIIYESERSVSV